MANDILTQDYLQSILEYRDGELYWKVNRGMFICNGMKAGSLDKKLGYYKVKIYKNYLLHRLIFLYHNGYLPVYVDHIDGNPLNNHIDNLREVTKSQNCINMRLKKANTSGCKNVHWSKIHKKWRVDIMVNQKKKFIGLFDDIELADLVAIEARNKYHGDYARHS